MLVIDGSSDASIDEELMPFARARLARASAPNHGWVNLECQPKTGNSSGKLRRIALMAAPRSLMSTAAVLLACAAALATVGLAFVPAPRAATPAAQSLPTAALSAAAMATPMAAHTDGGSVWIPALSAVGAGFAIGLAAIGSGVGQGIASGRCIDGSSRQPKVTDDLRGVLLLSLAFMDSLTIYESMIALALDSGGFAFLVHLQWQHT